MCGMYITMAGPMACRVMLIGPMPMTPGITIIGGIVLVGISHGDGMTHGGAPIIGDGTIRCIGAGIVLGMEAGLSTVVTITIT